MLVQRGISWTDSAISKQNTKTVKSQGERSHRKSYLRLDVDSERGKVSLDSDGIGRQRPRQVDEAIRSSSGHTGQLEAEAINV